MTYTVRNLDPQQLADFNAGIQAAIDDYWRVPNRACRLDGCTHLADDGATYCWWHRSGRPRTEDKK